MAEFADTKRAGNVEEEEDEVSSVEASEEEEEEDSGAEEGEKEEEEEEEEDTTLANNAVVTKYQEAARIVNSAMEAVAAACLQREAAGGDADGEEQGPRVLDICKLGDRLMDEGCGRVFNKKVKGKAVEKGVAFPTCISINECVCHYSPLESEGENAGRINPGDWVKIDMGCHIDGYIAIAAHTVMVPGGDSETTAAEAAAPTAEGGDATTGGRYTDTDANVIMAAHTAAELCMKLIKPGNTNAQVTQELAKVAEAYDVNFVGGTTMNEMKRYIIDGDKEILLRGDAERGVEQCEFEVYEVYGVDVAVSSGDGIPREQERRTTVFKRQAETNYRLRMKAARYLLNETRRRFTTVPFTLRAIEDERQARLGVSECLQHNVLVPYPVVYERTGDRVVHVKFTVMLLPSGTHKITGMALPTEQCTSDKELPEETRAILATSSKKRKKNKKKKNKNRNAEAASATATDGEAAAPAAST